MKKFGNWLMTREGFLEMCRREAQVESVGITGIEDFFTQRRELAVDENTGVATVHVTGALLNNPAQVERVLGNTAYQDILADLETAEAFGAEAIVLDIDSPGGMAEGAPETAAAIAKLKVPTFAYSEGYMCSAAYYLAAGCRRVVATSSSTVGSIGTVLRWCDCTALMEAMGVKEGAYTNTGADLKDIDLANPTPEQAEFVQAHIDEMATDFQRFVARHREDLDAEVFRAGYYGGRRGKTLGLVDEVGTRETLSRQLIAKLREAGAE